MSASQAEDRQFKSGRPLTPCDIIPLMSQKELATQCNLPAVIVALMYRVQQELESVDKSKPESYHTPLADVCNWNGLLITMNQKKIGDIPPQQLTLGFVSEGARQEFDSLLKHPAFQALAFIDSLNKNLEMIKPGLSGFLPNLTGTQHQLRTVISASFNDHDFCDQALSLVRLGYHMLGS